MRFSERSARLPWEPAFLPRRENRAKATRPFHVVLDQIEIDAAKEIDLQHRYLGAPAYRGHPHQMRLAAAGSASVENLNGRCVAGDPLLRVQVDVQVGRSDFSKQIELALFGKVGLRDGWTHDSSQVRSHLGT